VLPQLVVPLPLWLVQPVLRFQPLCTKLLLLLLDLNRVAGMPHIAAAVAAIVVVVVLAAGRPLVVVEVVAVVIVVVAAVAVVGLLELQQLLLVVVVVAAAVVVVVVRLLLLRLKNYTYYTHICYFYVLLSVYTNLVVLICFEIRFE
jgi:hypothetical protein